MVDNSFAKEMDDFVQDLPLAKIGLQYLKRATNNNILSKITNLGKGRTTSSSGMPSGIVYGEFQQGVLHRIDFNSGEPVLIQPQPREGENYERFNWDAPILVSPHKPERLYFASQRVWRSENRGDSWEPISSDLTRNEERIDLKIMGKRQGWDNA